MTAPNFLFRTDEVMSGFPPVLLALQNPVLSNKLPINLASIYFATVIFLIFITELFGYEMFLGNLRHYKN